MTTPAWNSASSNATAESPTVTQFLGTHQSLDIYEGVASTTLAVDYLPTQVAIGSALSPFFPLGDAFTIGPFLATGNTVLTGAQYTTNAISQPFTMSGNTITRVTLPISIAKGIGQDVMVSLQTDNAGAPSGTVLATALVPKEFQSLATSKSITQGFTGANAGLPASATMQPPYPLNITTNSASATDGTYLVVTGGIASPNQQSATAAAQIIDSVTGLGSWVPGASIPNNGLSTGIYNHQTTFLNGNLIITGGVITTTTSTTQTLIAPFTNGVIGGWVAGTSLATAIQSHTTIGVSSAQTGIANTVPSLFVIGGSTGGSNQPANNQIIQFNTLSTTSAAFAGAWTNLAVQFPVLKTYMCGTYSNGWMILAGGSDRGGTPFNGQSDVWAAKVNVDSVGNVTIGGWQVWPQLPVTIAAGTMTTFGNTVYITGGLLTAGSNANGAIYAMHVTAAGPIGGWVKIHATIAIIGGNGIAIAPSAISSTGILAAAAQTQPAILMPVTDVGLVSVPLSASGLTNGSVYHVVVSGIGGDPDNYSQLTMGSTAGTDALTNQSGVGWVHSGTGAGPLQGGSATFLSVYAGTYGKLLHTIEDTALPAKVQSVAASASTSTTIAATLAATLPGTTLIAYAIDRSSAKAMTLPAPWVTIFSDVDTVNNASQLLAYYPNNPGGVTTVTSTLTSGVTDNATLTLVEFSGLGPLDVATHSMNNAANTTMSFTSTGQPWDFAVVAYFDEVNDTTTITAGTGYTQVGARFGQAFLEFTNTNAVYSAGATTGSFNVNAKVTATATNNSSHTYAGGMALFTVSVPSRQTWMFPAAADMIAGGAEQVGPIRRVWVANNDNTGQIPGNTGLIFGNTGSNQGWGVGLYGAGSSPSLTWGQ